MKSVNSVWVVGALVAVSMGMAAQACSSSTTSPGGGAGGGTTGGSSTSSSKETGSNSSSSTSSGSATASGCGGSSSSTGAVCYKAPKELYPESAAGVYCPFSQNYPTKDTVCSAGQHCCEPPEKACMLSTCVADGTQCSVPESIDWQCAGTLDCASQGSDLICCGQGKVETQAAQPGCGDGGTTIPPYPYVSGFYGSACQKTCAYFGSGALPPEDGGVGFQVCSKDSECSANFHCVAIEPKGNTIGYCAAGAAPDAGSSSSGSSSSGSSASSASSVSKTSSTSGASTAGSTSSSG